WVSHYHLEYNKVITSRLHCYLPARSVGADVTFVPKNRSDNRFGGLIDTTDADFERIRQGILDKVSTMLQTIASGASEEEVYLKWREVCAPAMAEADERIAAAQLLSTGPAGLQNVLSASSSGTVQSQSTTASHVVIDIRAGEGKHVRRVLRSILSHTHEPMVLWLTGDSVPVVERRDIDDL